VSEEIILERNRVEVLIRELSAAIKLESVYQVNLRFTDDMIVITPRHIPVEIKR